MMLSDLERLIESIQKEKNIPRDVVIEILQSAMEAAARKKYGMTKDIEAQYNPELGEVELIEWRTVVEEVEDPDIEIILEEARQEGEDWQIGDSFGQIMNASDLGRIAAQTAKQVIIQRFGTPSASSRSTSSRTGRASSSPASSAGSRRATSSST